MKQWTPEEDAIIREFWARGDSATTIAARFPDRSRNAIIGRAHRLGLAKRPSPIEFGLSDEERRARRQAHARKRNEREKAQRRAMGIPAKPWLAHFGPRPVKGVRPPKDASKTGPLAIARMTDEDREPVADALRLLKVERPRHIEVGAVTCKTCQWIEAEKPRYSDADKCGKSTHRGAYCEEHALRAWRPMRETEARMAKGAEYTPREAAVTIGRL